MSEDTRRIVAILYSDVVGIVDATDPDVTSPVASDERTRSLVREFVEKHQGEWLREIGDGALCTFESAARAINCALDVQRAFAGGAGFQPRIGIHVGDLVFRRTEIGTDVFGDAVNVAARVQSLADPGAICATERVYEDLRNHPHTPDFKYLGERQLKNVNRPVKVYQIAGRPGPLFDEDATQPVETEARARWVVPALAMVVVAGIAVAAALWLLPSSGPELDAEGDAEFASQTAPQTLEAEGGSATQQDADAVVPAVPEIDPEVVAEIARQDAFSDVRKRLLTLEGSGAYSARVWTNPDPVPNEVEYHAVIEVDCDCLALLFSIDGSNDQITLIHPNPFSIDAAVTPGESVKIPAADSFHLIAIGGEGIDVLKLIVVSAQIGFITDRTQSWGAAVLQSNEQKVTSIWSATPEQPERVEELRAMLDEIETSAETFGWDEAAAPLQIVPALQIVP